MASGDTLLIFQAQHATFPTSNFATFDVRNNHVCLDFDASTNETAYFGAVLPQRYSGSGLDVLIHYAMTSATSGDVDFDAAFERIGDGQQDIDSDGFASANSTDNTTVPATSGHVDIVTISFSDGADMDSLAAGEAFRLSITRDAASDTATGDVELIAVEIREA